MYFLFTLVFIILRVDHLLHQQLHMWCMLHRNIIHVQHVIHAHCYLQLCRRKQVLPVLIYCLMSERCVYPLHIYHHAPFCHRILSSEVQDAQSLHVASSFLFVTCTCSGFLGTSGACWIVSCNVLWCRIRVHVQDRSVLHSLIFRSI